MGSSAQAPQVPAGSGDPWHSQGKTVEKRVSRGRRFLRANPSLGSAFLPLYPLASPKLAPPPQHLPQPRPQPSLTMEQGLCRQDKPSTRSPQSSAMFLYPGQGGLVPTSHSNIRQQTATHGLPDPIKIQNLDPHPSILAVVLILRSGIPMISFHSCSFSFSLHSLGLTLWIRPGFKSGLCFFPQDLWYFP